MKRTIIILSVFLASLPVSVLAQVTFTDKGIDIHWVDKKGHEMSLTKSLDSIPLLITFNDKIVRAGEYIDIDTNQEIYSISELASITGAKPKNIKAYRMLRGTDATRLWGVRGANGVLEVISPSRYRKLKNKGQLENFMLVAESQSKVGKPAQSNSRSDHTQRSVISTSNYEQNMLKDWQTK